MVVEVVEPMVADIFSRLVSDPQYVGFISLLIVVVIMLRLKAPIELTLMGGSVWVLVGGQIGLFGTEALIVAAIILAGMIALGFYKVFSR